MNSEASCSNAKPNINLSEWMEWQRKLQFSASIHNSVDTQIFTELLQYADTKRFNIPANTQNPNFASQIIEDIPKPVAKKSPKKKLPKNTSQALKKKNFDIRDLFQKIHRNNNEEQIIYEEKLKETLEDCGVATDDKVKKDLLLEKENISSVLIDLMVVLNIEKSKNNFTDVPYTKYPKYSKTILKDAPSCFSPFWSIPNTSIIDELTKIRNIDLNDLNIFKEKQTPSKVVSPIKDDLKFISTNFEMSNDSFVNTSAQSDQCGGNFCENKLDANFDIGDIDEIFGNSYNSNEKPTSSVPSPCKNPKPILMDVNISNDSFANNLVKSNDKCEEIGNNFHENKLDDNFNIGDLDEIFGNSYSPNEVESSKVCVKVNENLNKSKNPLEFFGLDDVEDIFADGSIEDSTNKNKCDNNNPNTKSCTTKVPHSRSPSPILLTQRQKSFLKHSTFNENCMNNSNDRNIFQFQTQNYQQTKISKDKVSESFFQPRNPLLNSSCHNSTINNKSDSAFHNVKNISKSNNDTSLFTVTQIINMINVPSSKSDKTNQIKSHNDEDGSDDSNESLILCSQVQKKCAVNKSINILPHKPHMTVLETSESSSDESVTCVSDEVTSSKRITNVPKDIPSKFSSTRTHESAKRKLNSSDEDNEYSPFFKKTPLFSSPSNKIVQSSSIPCKPSLKEKLNLTLRNCNKNNFTQDKDKLQQNSSISEHFNNDSNDNTDNAFVKEDFKLTHISQLQQFSKQSQPQWLSKQRHNRDNKQNTSLEYNNFNSSDSECDDFVPRKSRKIMLSPPTHVRKKKKIQKKKKPKSEFIQYEAEISGDSFEHSSDENDTSDEHDSSIVKFICDEDHVEHDRSVDMEAKYLQSVKSPVQGHGKFKIPVLPNKQSKVSVFSQVDPDEHPTYVLDSFCVDDDELTQRYEMSELDIAEAILKKRKRRKQKNEEIIHEVKDADDPAGDSPIAKNMKKRIRLQIESESSTDEDLFA